MVETILIHKILKRLEKYLIRKCNYRLLGDTYDLILLSPSDQFLSDTKYSLIISAKKLDTLNQIVVIKELLSDFKEVLKFDEYNTISRLNTFHTTDPFVKNVNFMFAFREQLIEINNIPIGGVQIDFAILVKSLVLDKLIEGHALTLELTNRSTINAGIIRIEQNFDVVHYTGKGLREIFKPDMTDEEKKIAEDLKTKTEEFLIESQHISKTPLDNIQKVF